MLIGNDTSGRKKQKIFEKMHKQGNGEGKSKPLFFMVLGTLFTVMAAFFGIISFRHLPARALGDWKLISNQGVRMDHDGTLTVMRGARIFLENYKEEAGEAVYTVCSPKQLSSDEQADIGSNGVRYGSGQEILLESRPGMKSNTCTFFIKKERKQR